MRYGSTGAGASSPRPSWATRDGDTGGAPALRGLGMAGRVDADRAGAVRWMRPSDPVGPNARRRAFAARSRIRRLALRDLSPGGPIPPATDWSIDVGRRVDAGLPLVPGAIAGRRPRARQGVGARLSRARPAGRPGSGRPRGVSRWHRTPRGRVPRAIRAAVMGSPYLCRCGPVPPRHCWICHRAGAGTVDHVIPVSRGGGSDAGNLRPAHSTCNERRQAGIVLDPPASPARPPSW